MPARIIGLRWFTRQVVHMVGVILLLSIILMMTAQIVTISFSWELQERWLVGLTWSISWWQWFCIFWIFLVTWNMGCNKHQKFRTSVMHSWWHQLPPLHLPLWCSIFWLVMYGKLMTFWQHLYWYMWSHETRSETADHKDHARPYVDCCNKNYRTRMNHSGNKIPSQCYITTLGLVRLQGNWRGFGGIKLLTSQNPLQSLAIPFVEWINPTRP